MEGGGEEGGGRDTYRTNVLITSVAWYARGGLEGGGEGGGVHGTYCTSVLITSVASYAGVAGG